MKLHPRRRNLVVFSSSVGLVHRSGDPLYQRRVRTGRIRRCVRIGGLLVVIAVRPRWRPLLAGVVLTSIGVMLRNGPGGVVLIPGLLLSWQALLIGGDSDSERERRSRLERELAEYSTAAHRCDLEATLDRYPDGMTSELRDILATQATAADNIRVPGAGWC